jgi:hypothetical protein
LTIELKKKTTVRIIVTLLLIGMLTTTYRLAETEAPFATFGAEIAPDRYRVTLLTEKMPLGLFHGSAAWDGQFAYIFGGWDDRHASGVIVRFDLKTKSATALLDNLPSPRSGTAAIYANGTVYNVHNVCYIFGGDSGSEYYNASKEIVRFFPSDSWWDIPVKTLPGRMDMSVIWDGKAAYLFGGKTSIDSIPSALSDEIVKFTPLTQIAILQAKLPHVRADSAAIWDGKDAYIFGGWCINEPNQIQYLDDIVRFNPDTDEVVTMKAKLPTGRAFTSAAWDGQYAYVFGGRSELANGTGIDLDEIVRYDPSTDTVQVLPVKLPFGTEAAMAVWTGSETYIFGGGDIFHGGNWRDNIVMMSIKPESNQWSGFDLTLIYVLIVIVVFVFSSLHIVNKRRGRNETRQSQERVQALRTLGFPKF